MTRTTSTFGYQDAILVACSQADVARAIARHMAETDAPAAAPAHPASAPGPRWRFLALPDTPRLPDLLVQPGTSGPAVPGEDDIRISTLVAAPDWTLIEMREQMEGISFLSASLSEQLPGRDVIYLRWTVGRGGPEQWAFHLYRDADAVRRRLSHRDPDGTPEPFADGPATRYEPPAAAEAPLDARELEAILNGIGLSQDTLFGKGTRLHPHLFTRSAR
ncbi:hypothetical protein [Histidinibacterium aquaticum]|uniref:Uncharacterized protein n=1 Tax=Histidinibacterium aquaticum TaxID=2613962 RepID=A0A5J5GFW8_9RHOB|nr:hypothetical protein [Histidinibacterium aquaticum]KAA9007119.1 hypothetical protein F3S47_15270 [Histidinibacterium aquaticum]